MSAHCGPAPKAIPAQPQTTNQRKGAVLMDKVITVSREFGSGGRELGVKLAEKLEIPFMTRN